MTQAAQIDLKALVRDVHDFPKPGIVFKDIAPLLRNPSAMRAATDRMAAPFLESDIDVVVAAEARGFLFGPGLAERLNAAFSPVRKPGKLPYSTKSVEYELEYGTDKLEIHTDGIAPGEKVLLVDDVLATGGTMAATARLVEELGGHVSGFSFLIELKFLDGQAKLGDAPVHSLIEY
jgi:adenine phosphoribosyltransferase